MQGMRINRHALRAIQERSDLSVTALALTIGKDQSTLSNILAGRREPSESTAQALADALGIDIEAIRVDPPSATDALKVLAAAVRAELAQVPA